MNSRHVEIIFTTYVEEVDEGICPFDVPHWFFKYDNEQEGYVEIEELWEPLGSFIG